jgi:hypothetical protein
MVSGRAPGRAEGDEVNRTLERCAQWIRQLLCFHWHPRVRVDFGWYEADCCKACGKTMTRYFQA